MKNSVLIIITALIAAGFLSCSQKKNKLEPKRTVITGIVTNFSDNAHLLVLNYCNPFSDKNRFTQDLIESNGRFHIEHEYVFAQHITMRFANKFINLFVHPGDSIFVSIDANEIQSNYFKDKDVIFINLCLASDVGTWEPTITKHNIDGENYYLGNNATDLFIGEYNLRGYPSYLIIDKTGAIHNPAPRPSGLESTIYKIESFDY